MLSLASYLLFPIVTGQVANEIFNQSLPHFSRNQSSEVCSTCSPLIINLPFLNDSVTVNTSVDDVRRNSATTTTTTTTLLNSWNVSGAAGHQEFLFLNLSLTGRVTNASDSPPPPPPPLTTGGSTAESNLSSYLLNNSLPIVLKKAAGYYRDPARTALLGLEKTVLVTGGNFGYLNHIHNFNCFVERLGLKYMVISMELHTHYYLQRHGFLSFYLNPSSAGANDSSNAIKEQDTQFRETQFNLITNRKKKAVYDIMLLGYDVVFSDSDVVFRKDPLQYMIFRNVDYVHSLNMLCPTGYNWDFYTSKAEGNTGLYFVRSTNATRYLWYMEYLESFKQPNLDDQTIFWRMIRGTKVSSNASRREKMLMLSCSFFVPFLSLVIFESSS